MDDATQVPRNFCWMLFWINGMAKNWSPYWTRARLQSILRSPETSHLRVSYTSLFFVPFGFAQVRRYLQGDSSLISPQTNHKKRTILNCFSLFERKLHTTMASKESTNRGIKSLGNEKKQVKVDPRWRNGKWTVEETDYIELLMEEFRFGTLPLAEGTSLRYFLSKMLNCE